MKRFIKPGLKLGVCTVILACSACNSKAPDSVRKESGDSNAQSPKVEKDSDSTVDVAENWNRQVSNAVADLARRTGLQVGSITIRSARSVTWGSSAMGCPQPDSSYTEVLVDGLQLLLEADGAVYYYLGKNGEDLIYCPRERVRAPAYGPGEEIM